MRLSKFHSWFLAVSFALACSTFVIILPVQAFCLPSCDLKPGLGIRDDFLLGNDVEAAVTGFVSKYGIENENFPLDSSENYLDTGHGVRLFYDSENNNINQIVVNTPYLFTDQGINVNSSLEDVLIGYGDEFELSIPSPLNNCYLLNYSHQGIGFVFKLETNLVEKIVLFEPEWTEYEIPDNLGNRC